MTNSSPAKGFYTVNSGTGATSVYLKQSFICEKDVYLFGVDKEKATLGEYHSGTTGIRFLSNEHLLILGFGLIKFISKSPDLLKFPLLGDPNSSNIQDFALKVFTEISRRQSIKLSEISNTYQNDIFHSIHGMIGAYNYEGNKVQTEITLNHGEILSLPLPNSSESDVTLLSRLSAVLMPKYRDTEPHNHELLVTITLNYFNDLLTSFGRPFSNLDDTEYQNDLLTPFILI